VGHPNPSCESSLILSSIRYAAPPTGSLRWQAPQAPTVNRSSIPSAANYGAVCPQNPDATGAIVAESTQGASEDCLFLNVYAPNNGTTSPLPVVVWIHGGGYGGGSSRLYDCSSMINTTGNNFIAGM
jgi:carboxylesterase type B